MESRTGELITAAQATSGVFIWEVPNPLYFKITDHHRLPFNMTWDIKTVQIRFNHNLRRALGLHQWWMDFKIWTALHPQTGRFLRVFSYQVLKYLDMLGVISINNVVNAVEHVMYNVLTKTVSIEQANIIKFNVY
uniref:Replication enhancer n=1 Tax=Jatropha leaf yellow mosaic Katarniaghat virus TaxID=1530093 RepID=G9FJB2_9GEMI|nr:replication enhancer protein [Jatropha leaf yellow mosaic Katarniaghat virus]